MINFHYQNLNDASPKRYWSHGRFWLNHGAILHVEWSAPAHAWPALTLQLNGYDDAIQFHISFFFISLFISNQSRWLYRKLEPITKRKDQAHTNGRQIGFSFFDSSLHIYLWYDTTEYRSKDPKWWSFTINFADIFLGKQKYKTETIKQGDAVIDMPEGSYPALYKIETQTWKRPRWFARSMTSICFDIPAGIPHEGKGENSWDCGMDGTFGISTEWKGNIYEAAKRVALRCLTTRQKYGSLSDPAYGEWRRTRLGMPANTEKV